MTATVHATDIAYFLIGPVPIYLRSRSLARQPAVRRVSFGTEENGDGAISPGGNPCVNRKLPTGAVYYQRVWGVTAVGTCGG